MNAKDDAAPQQESKGARRYPEHLMFFGGSHVPVDPEFARRREEFLLDFAYSTARAYWADLQSFYEWCAADSLDWSSVGILELDGWSDCLNSDGYSAGAVRRRVSVARRFLRVLT